MTNLELYEFIQANAKNPDLRQFARELAEHFCASQSCGTGSSGNDLEADYRIVLQQLYSPMPMGEVRRKYRGCSRHEKRRLAVCGILGGANQAALRAARLSGDVSSASEAAIKRSVQDRCEEPLIYFVEQGGKVGK